MASSHVSPEELGNTLARTDVSAALVDVTLDAQRETEAFYRFSLEQWELLKDRPNLRHFIAASSFEVAPHDPIEREKVANALIGLLDLLYIATTESVGQQVDDIFSTTSGDGDANRPL